MGKDAETVFITLMNNKRQLTFVIFLIHALAGAWSCEKMCRTVFITILLLTLSLSAVAGELVGKVTKVSDGDTIWIVTDSGREKVRLDRIDAPEKDQPFGKEASEMLAKMIKDKRVKVEFQKRDQYGRILGIVFDGPNDINLTMVREGGAWHYRYFDKTKAYENAEVEARKAKRGLWALPNPVNPYDWRSRKGWGFRRDNSETKRGHTPKSQ